MFRVWSNVELLGKVCSCQQDTVTVKIDRRWSEKWRERFIWSLLNYNTTADLMPEQPLPHLSASRRNNLKEDFCSQQSHRLRSNLKSHLNPQLYFFFFSRNLHRREAGKRNSQSKHVDPKSATIWHRACCRKEDTERFTRLLKWFTGRLHAAHQNKPSVITLWYSYVSNP